MYFYLKDNYCLLFVKQKNLTKVRNFSKNEQIKNIFVFFQHI